MHWILVGVGVWREELKDGTMEVIDCGCDKEEAFEWSDDEETEGEEGSVIKNCEVNEEQSLLFGLGGSDLSILM